MNAKEILENLGYKFKEIALLQELIDKETPNDGPCASCVSNNKNGVEIKET